MEQRADILLIEMNLGVLGNKAWQGWHIFHKDLVVLLARYIPFFTCLITVVTRRATAVGAATRAVTAVVAVTLVVILITAFLLFILLLRGIVHLLLLGVHLRQHLRRRRIRLGFPRGRSSRHSLPSGLHALLVVLPLQMRVEMNGRGGDEVAHFATHFHVLRLYFFDAFQHARVLLALHMGFVDDARVELQIAHFASEMAFVCWVYFAEFALLSGLPLFLLHRQGGRDRAERDRRKEGVEPGLLELLDVGLAAQVSVENPGWKKRSEYDDDVLPLS